MTFDAIARGVIVEAALTADGITPTYILDQWLKSRYREVIDALALGDINRASDFVFTTVAAIKGSNATATQGSDRLTASGFSTAMTGRYVRVSNNNDWYRIKAVLNTTVLLLDTTYAEPSVSNTSYTIAQRFYSIDSAIRWIIDIKNPLRAMTLTELSQAKLDEMFPNRAWAPAVPQWWAPAGWDDLSGRRLVEIYPPSDVSYRIEVVGYEGINAPTLDSSPHKDVNDRILGVGGLADAYFYKAGKLAELNEWQASTACLRIASIHAGKFNSLVDQLTARDSRAAPQPRVRLLIQRSASYGIYDPLITAEQEVWNRSPKVG